MTPLDFEHYPWSHSLAMATFWAVVFALVYRAFRGSERAAAWLAVVVLSHWIFDLIVHRPDLPLAPGIETRVGFGVWNHRLATASIHRMESRSACGSNYRSRFSRERKL